MRIAFLITDHGLGHAARATTLIQRLVERGAQVQVITNVPRAFLVESIPIPASPATWEHYELKTDVGMSDDVHPAAADKATGVFQKTSIEIDWQRTVFELEQHWAGLEAKVAALASALSKWGAEKVVFDICALGAKLAKKLGLPSVAVSNFTWDWIYAPYAKETPALSKFVALHQEAYRSASLFLALPYTATDLRSFDGVPRTDVGLLGRRATRTRAETLAALGLGALEPCRLLLLSFGGHQFPISDFFPRWRIPPEWRVIWVAQGDAVVPAGHEQVVVLRQADVRAKLPYIDLVAAVDAVLCKTGYGIVSELILCSRPTLYTDRPGFIEHEWMIKALHDNVTADRVEFEEVNNMDERVFAKLARIVPCTVRPSISFNGADEAATIILTSQSSATPAPDPATAPAGTVLGGTPAAPPKKKDAKKKKKPAAGAAAGTEAAPSSPATPGFPSSSPPPSSSGSPIPASPTPAPPAAGPAEEKTEERAGSFEKELAWCVKQVELGLRRRKLDDKQVKESRAVLEKLTSAKVPMAQKRHLMRVCFGDYRQRMRDEQQGQRSASKEQEP